MLYTIIMDYKGGTYISQGHGANPTEGAISAVENHDYSDIPDLVSADKTSIVLEIEETGLNPINGMKNVFCATADIGDSMAIFNVVETNET